MQFLITGFYNYVNLSNGLEYFVVWVMDFDYYVILCNGFPSYVLENLDNKAERWEAQRLCVRDIGVC
jgi:transposase InsO family protein